MTLVSAVLVAQNSTAHAPTTGAVAQGFRAGHILVRFKTSQPQAILDQLNNAFGAKAVGRIAELRVTHKSPPQDAEPRSL